MLVSNDGGTILNELLEHMEFKLSKFALKWGKSLKDSHGDGVKSFYILLSEILKKTEKLLKQGVPRGAVLTAIGLINENWEKFCNKSELNIDADMIENQDFLNDYLLSTIYGRLSIGNAKHLVKMVLNACDLLGNYILSPMFRPEKFFRRVFVPGSLIKDSHIMNGVLIGKAPVNLSILPKQGLNKPRIMLIRDKLYTDLPDDGQTSPSGFEFDFKINDPLKLRDLNNSLKDKSKSIFLKINKFSPNVIITHKGVDRNLESLLNINNITLVRRAKTEEFEYLGRFLNVEIVDNVNEISEINIATADRLVYERIGRDMQIVIKKNSLNPLNSRDSTHSKFNKKLESLEKTKNNIPSMGSIIIGGSLWVVCEEVERLFLKLIKSFQSLKKHNKIFYGGGNTEIKFIRFIKKQGYENNINPKTAYALNKLTESFKIIPYLLIQNSGMDAVALINDLNAEFISGNINVGFEINEKSIMNMKNVGIYENYKSKSYMFKLLFEALNQLVRIDVILIKKKKTESTIHKEEE